MSIVDRVVEAYNRYPSKQRSPKSRPYTHTKKIIYHCEECGEDFSPSEVESNVAKSMPLSISQEDFKRDEYIYKRIHSFFTNNQTLFKQYMSYPPNSDIAKSIYRVMRKKLIWDEQDEQIPEVIYITHILQYLKLGKSGKTPRLPDISKYLDTLQERVKEYKSDVFYCPNKTAHGNKLVELERKQVLVHDRKPTDISPLDYQLYKSAYQQIDEYYNKNAQQLIRDIDKIKIDDKDDALSEKSENTIHAIYNIMLKNGSIDTSIPKKHYEQCLYKYLLESKKLSIEKSGSIFPDIESLINKLSHLQYAEPTGKRPSETFYTCNLGIKCPGHNYTGRMTIDGTINKHGQYCSVCGSPVSKIKVVDAIPSHQVNVSRYITNPQVDSNGRILAPYRVVLSDTDRRIISQSMYPRNKLVRNFEYACKNCGVLLKYDELVDGNTSCPKCGRIVEERDIKEHVSVPSYRLRIKSNASVYQLSPAYYVCTSPPDKCQGSHKFYEDVKYNHKKRYVCPYCKKEMAYKQRSTATRVRSPHHLGVGIEEYIHIPPKGPSAWDDESLVSIQPSIMRYLWHAGQLTSIPQYHGFAQVIQWGQTDGKLIAIKCDKCGYIQSVQKQFVDKIIKKDCPKCKEKVNFIMGSYITSGNDHDIDDIDEAKMRLLETSGFVKSSYLPAGYTEMISLAKGAKTNTDYARAIESVIFRKKPSAVHDTYYIHVNNDECKHKFIIEEMLTSDGKCNSCNGDMKEINGPELLLQQYLIPLYNYYKYLFSHDRTEEYVINEQFSILKKLDDIFSEKFRFHNMDDVNRWFMSYGVPEYTDGKSIGTLKAFHDTYGDKLPQLKLAYEDGHPRIVCTTSPLILRGPGSGEMLIREDDGSIRFNEVKVIEDPILHAISPNGVIGVNGIQYKSGGGVTGYSRDSNVNLESVESVNQILCYRHNHDIINLGDLIKKSEPKILDQIAEKYNVIIHDENGTRLSPEQIYENFGNGICPKCVAEFERLINPLSKAGIQIPSIDDIIREIKRNTTLLKPGQILPEVESINKFIKEIDRYVEENFNSSDNDIQHNIYIISQIHKILGIPSKYHTKHDVSGGGGVMATATWFIIRPLIQLRSSVTHAWIYPDAESHHMSKMISAKASGQPMPSRSIAISEEDAMRIVDDDILPDYIKKTKDTFVREMRGSVGMDNLLRVYPDISDAIDVPKPEYNTQLNKLIEQDTLLMLYIQAIEKSNKIHIHILDNFPNIYAFAHKIPEDILNNLTDKVVAGQEAYMEKQKILQSDSVDLDTGISFMENDMKFMDGLEALRQLKNIVEKEQFKLMRLSPAEISAISYSVTQRPQASINVQSIIDNIDRIKPIIQTMSNDILGVIESCNVIINLHNKGLNSQQEQFWTNMYNLTQEHGKHITKMPSPDKLVQYMTFLKDAVLKIIQISTNSNPDLVLSGGNTFFINMIDLFNNTDRDDLINKLSNDEVLVNNVNFFIKWVDRFIEQYNSIGKPLLTDLPKWEKEISDYIGTLSGSSQNI